MADSQHAARDLFVDAVSTEDQLSVGNDSRVTATDNADYDNKSRTTFRGGTTAGASALKQTFLGHTHMIGQKVIRLDCMVGGSVWYARSGFYHRPTHKVGKCI